MYSHSFKVRVRYSETDKMGFVYYGRYLEFYEMGRTNLIRSLGMTYRYMEDELQVGLPVIRVEVNYKKPAYYDDELEVVTRIEKMPMGTIEFITAIYCEGDLLNEGTVRLCFMDNKTGKATRPPKLLVEKLKSHFE